MSTWSVSKLFADQVAALAGYHYVSTNAYPLPAVRHPRAEPSPFTNLEVAGGVNPLSDLGAGARCRSIFNRALGTILVKRVRFLC